MAGGNSVYADGQIAVVGSAAQKAAGIEDSIETFMNDALTAGLNLNYKDKLQLVGEKSNEVFEWTVSEIGVEWPRTRPPWPRAAATSIPTPPHPPPT